MIPTSIEEHLRRFHPEFQHHVHDAAMTAQELAEAEHVTGHRVAKPVVVKLDGKLAIAVVAATDQVWLGSLEEALGTRAELVDEAEFAGAFEPCDAGAEPPLAMFGLPIFADEKLIRESKLLMQAGTHEDAILVDTHAWMRCEHVQPIANLGA